MIAIEGGSLVLEDRVIDNGVLTVEGCKIKGIGPGYEVAVSNDVVHIDASGCWVMPGFIDLHVHGGGGSSFTTYEPSQILEACRFHLEHGTTTLLATCAAPVDQIPLVLGTIVSVIDGPHCPPNLLGIHLEGPFISPRFAGAFPPEAISPPDVRLLRDCLDIAQGFLRIMTLAPEYPGARECVRLAVKNGVIVSAGHTEASLAEFERAVADGVSHSCHLFNAMRPLNHRDPGIIGGVLTIQDVSTEIIADGLHVHPRIIRLALLAKGVQGISLITDCVRYAGMSDGFYEDSLGAYSVTVNLEDGLPRVNNGVIAGSTLTMNHGIKVLIEKVGLNIIEASQMASSTPARVLGVYGRKGSLSPGKDADFVLLDKLDFFVKQVWVAGRCEVDNKR